ncbi:MAG: GHKL domain-containing protein [Bacteroidetes bacterium]|nr:GHKL domain-containing protein [Bacteroidota bacterium]
MRYLDKYIIKGIFAIVIIILSHTTLLGVFLILRSIYFHSQWTIDITSDIDFASYKIICLLIFVLISGLYFLLNHMLTTFFIRIYRNHQFFAAFIFILTSVLYGLFLSQFTEGFDWLVIVLNSGYFALLVGFNIPRSLTRINYSTYLYLFLAAIVCAITGSYSLYNFNEEKNVIDKRRFVTQLLYENDVLGEYLLEEAAKQIKKDIFIQNRLLSPFSSKDIIEQKIKRVYLNNYFDKYDTKIYILNAQGDLFSSSPILPAAESKPGSGQAPLDNKYLRELSKEVGSPPEFVSGHELQEDSTCYYQKLLDRYKKKEYSTQYPDLYFIKDISEHGKQPRHTGYHLTGSLQNRYIKFIEIEKACPESLVPHRRSPESSRLSRYKLHGEAHKPNVETCHIGKIVIDLKLKKIIPNSVIPELLLDKRFVQLHFSKQYSFAVFAGNNLIYSFGDYNYGKDIIESLFNFNDIYGQGIKLKGFHHLLVGDEHARSMQFGHFHVKDPGDPPGGKRDGKAPPSGRTMSSGHRASITGGREASAGASHLQQTDKHIIITSSTYSFQNIFSNFSFLFLLLSFFILLFVIIYAGIERYRKKDTRTNYSTKIQIFLNVAFFLPLIIVSITTLSLINSSYKKDIRKQYLKNAERASINIAASLEKYKKGKLDKGSLTNQLLLVAKYSESDINLFSTDGRLIISSQPLIFEEGLLSKLINPEAYAEIIEQNNKQILLSESVGNLKYNAVYAGIRSFDTGDMLGIISIPFFDSKSELDNQLIEVLTMIMNIFTSVFILFLLFSYFASQTLIYPLTLITQKIKRTTLGAENEPLEWTSNDEIGFLVSEYNQMLVKLEESKKALAQSEKQSGWREMAKQVAHEIKNPLTPMKLTLQHLQYAIREKRSDVKEVTEKTVKTLITQIETLNDITNSFSLFANMPVPKNEKIDIGKVLKRTIDLFNNSTPASNIKYQISNIKYPVYVMADEQVMNRIFTNLLLNAIESVPNTRKPEILVRLSTSNQQVVVEIKDNGIGIPDEIKDKIFIPSFSTKPKGSGIGLAVAKRGMELAGGKIWFETKTGKGTSFFIELGMLD